MRRSLCLVSPSACIERIRTIIAILDSLTPEVNALPWTSHGGGARALRLYGAAPYRPQDRQDARPPGALWPSCARSIPSPSVFADQQDGKHGHKASPVMNASGEPHPFACWSPINFDAPARYVRV